MTEGKDKPVPRLVLKAGFGDRIVKYAGRVKAGEPFDYPDEAEAKAMVDANGFFEFYKKPAVGLKAKAKTEGGK